MSVNPARRPGSNGTHGKLASDGGANPYSYGHMTEVTVKPDGTTTVAKHYSMGRLSFEQLHKFDQRLRAVPAAAGRGH